MEALYNLFIYLYVGPVIVSLAIVAFFGPPENVLKVNNAVLHVLAATFIPVANIVFLIGCLYWAIATLIYFLADHVIPRIVNVLIVAPIRMAMIVFRKDED